jgi:hypothetical protein
MDTPTPLLYMHICSMNDDDGGGRGETRWRKVCKVQGDIVSHRIAVPPPKPDGAVGMHEGRIIPRIKFRRRDYYGDCIGFAIVGRRTVLEDGVASANKKGSACRPPQHRS